MTKTGEISWDDSGSKQRFNREDFIKLENGTNAIRLVTNPFKYLVHKVKFENDKSFGRNVRCAGNGCPLCAEGNKPQDAYITYAINRKDGKIKKYEFKTQIMKSIQTLRQNFVQYKDVKTFDLMIVVNPQGGATGYYTVIPGPQSPLTPSEQVEIDKLDIGKLEEYCAFVSPSEVTDSIERIANWIAKNNKDQTQPQQPQQQTQTVAKKKAPVTPVVHVEEEDEEEDKEVDDGLLTFRVSSKK